MNENLDEIGKIADTLDNLTAAMSMDIIPAEMHLEGMKQAIPIISARRKKRWMLYQVKILGVSNQPHLQRRKTDGQVKRH